MASLTLRPDALMRFPSAVRAATLAALGTGDT
jgi:hypothetical protein